jgi:sulfoxide reductase heme-binding subunit YedZ
VHLTSSSIDWYAARAAGVAAYVILTAVLVLGLTMAGKKNFPRWPKFAVEDVHRFGGLLVGTFVSIHVLTIAIDSYLPFSIGSLMIPFLSPYKPLWVALGIVAAELLLALAVTNHYRDLLSYAFWRRAHYVNFAVWAAVVLHGLGSGTDRASAWFIALYATGAAVVAGATAWRITRVRRPRWGVVAPAASALIVAVAVVGLARGPLQTHRHRWNMVTFREHLSGQVQRQSGVTRGIISMAGTGDGPQRVLVRADLLIAPTQLVSTSFQMEYLPSGLVCRGRVAHVHAYGFEATCRVPSGARRFVHAEWKAGQGTELADGIIAAHA